MFMSAKSSGSAAGTVFGQTSAVWFVLALILAAYCGLALLSAITSRPNGDEGLFADPAITLITKGYMGTPVREQTPGLPGLERWTYWVMPLHLVVLAGWYKIFGIGLMQMRILSIVWGSVCLAALISLVWRLGLDLWVVVVAAALSATDYIYVGASASGRMDGMAAALGFLGLAVYCNLRDKRLGLAMLMGHLSVAAAVFTHPNGVIFFVCLMFLIIVLDRDRLRISYLLTSAAPYLAGAAAWGLYIMQSPQTFLAQWLWQIRMKAGDGVSFSPVGYVVSEFHRYVDAYGMGSVHARGVSGPVVLKAMVLAAYLLAVLALLRGRELRENRGFRLLFSLTALVFLIMLFFNEKLTRYLLNITPLYDTLLAIVLVGLYRRGRTARAIAILSFASLLTIQAGGLILRSRFDAYARQFLPAVEFVRERLQPGTTVIASADFGFGIGFDRTTDDWTLGFYAHERPKLVVIEEQYLHALDTLGRKYPQILQHVNRTLREDYRLVYDHEYYQVYELRSGELSPSGSKSAPDPL